MRTMVILLVLLSLSAAEDAALMQLRSEQLRLADELQRYSVELARAAALAEFPITPVLFERFRRQHDDLTAQAGTGQVPLVDADTAKAALSGTRALVEGASQLTGRLNQLGYLTQNFLPTPVQPDPQRPYRDQMVAMISGWVTSLVTEGKLTQQSMAETLRWHQLTFAISLVRCELLINDGQTQVPAGEAPASDCVAWCRAARARLDADLASPPANDDQQEALRRSQAYDLADKRLDLWRMLVYAVGRRRATTQPPFSAADGPGLPALGVSLDRQVENLRAHLAIYGDKDVLSSEAYDEINRLDGEFNHLEESESVAMNAISWQREFIRTRQALAEQLAICAEQTQQDFARRLDQIAADAAMCQTHHLNGLIKHDRVAAAEATGDQELVKVRLDALGAEVESAVSLTESETRCRLHAQDPALRVVIQRFQDLREKLGEAFAKHLQILVAQQQVRNRITMLQLKEELTDAQVGNAEAVIQRLRDELSQVREDLEAAGERAKEAKDAKDAERIPLVQPGADDF